MVAYGVFAFVFALVAFFIIKSFFGLRVSAEEESKGLDVGEHGLEAYQDFEGVSERLS